MVPRPLRLQVLDDLVQADHIVLGQLDLDRVLPDPLGAGGTRDGDDGGLVGPATQGDQPVDGDLARGAPLLGRQLLDLSDQAQVLLKDVRLEAREHAPEVVRWEVGEGFDLAGEDAVAEGGC